MNVSKNLLVVTPASPLDGETRHGLHEYVREHLGFEVLILQPGDKVELHNNDLADKIDRLCDGIANLVEVNQAILEYMINADQEPEEPPRGASLDG